MKQEIFCFNMVDIWIKSALRRTSGMIPELYNSGIPELPSSRIFQNC